MVALVTGVGYAVLAARRNRLCWIAGAVSSAAAAIVAGLSALPMQSGLQVLYVVMAVYGWWSWTRSSANGGLLIGTYPLQLHLFVGLALIVLSIASARVLASETSAAWPLLDSLATWFSLFATWLAADARLENWIYWVVIDLVLVYLFYVQRAPLLALLNLLFIGIAVAGLVEWRRRLRSQSQASSVPA
jgi:nicotinamide mononucleotide transporter